MFLECSKMHRERSAPILLIIFSVLNLGRTIGGFYLVIVLSRTTHFKGTIALSGEFVHSCIIFPEGV
jgi:hypothetical protein